jgi:hypothetical protein
MHYVKLFVLMGECHVIQGNVGQTVHERERGGPDHSYCERYVGQTQFMREICGTDSVHERYVGQTQFMRHM